MTRGDRGAVLLEALVAVTILASAGVAAAGLAAASLRAELEASIREAEVRDCSRFLAALSLLTKADLDRRFGWHDNGRLYANVQRPLPGLYRISVGLASAPEVETLVTVVYRPAEAHR